ncbi:GNAT family N-acetyltransferase [Streptomyces sp. FXJ1.172]|uniref:GNAT family N-acetyltransferase n=1 Tax=Streptomyces sp. FXJ1.172 TaxID=710705 RepID=UPI000A4D932D|nr:GNAT family N-acetyltransferase [Streptomyces sp. FXJ1.172]WEO98185.1 GNAT family N-acetyltransferase [Streptomyces sp. FXJ1.172]
MISDRMTGARVIRTAVPAEAEVIAALHHRARSTYYPDGLPDDGIDWTAAWRSAVGRPDGQVLCVVDQGAITAIASFRPPADGPADVVRLFQFHVDPDRWRTGIGTDLHAACVEQWRADRMRSAVLDVHVDNRRAQAFYARLGWVPDPENPPADGDHHLFLRFSVPGE